VYHQATSFTSDKITQAIYGDGYAATSTFASAVDKLNIENNPNKTAIAGNIRAIVFVVKDSNDNQVQKVLLNITYTDDGLIHEVITEALNV
jgi:hypothetical protein